MFAALSSLLAHWNTRLRGWFSRASARVYALWLRLLHAVGLADTTSQPEPIVEENHYVAGASPLYTTTAAMSDSRAASRRHSEKKLPLRRRLTGVQLFRLASIGMFALVLLGIVGFFSLFVYYSRSLPKPGEVVQRVNYSTRIYDRNGVLLYDLFNDERRIPIKIDEIPQDLKDATISIEDKDFYNHQGFDWLTVVRIPYNYVVRQRVVGGSTLTQQLVKNALLTNEKSISRKFKEFVLSLQLERTYSKDQILEMYFNEAPYGGNGRGVGIAAEMYFNKSVKDLTLAEAIVLAGLPQRPTAYSPFSGRVDDEGTPLWKMRALGVARRMQEDGKLTSLKYDEVLAAFDQMEFTRTSIDIKAPHFVFYVRDKLEEMYGIDSIEQAGYEVTTSLDVELQQQIQTATQEEIDKVQNLNISNGAVLAMNPQNGEILAMVGSRDYNNKEIGGEYNVVVDGLRQPGSSIKPLTYLALLRKGYTPASMLMDVPTTFQATDNDKPYEPGNYDGTFRGPVTVRNSLGSSLNIPAVKALALVGVPEFLKTAESFGLTTLAPTPENTRRFGLAVTLGGAEVHMIDLVSAYSAFANGGTKIEPVPILKVKDRNGRTLYEHKSVRGQRVMSEGESFLINNILSDNNARAGAFGTRSLLNMGDGVAVKTGTTNDLKDNWAIGWSKDVIVGTWVGNNDNTSMKGVASGISGATPIWRRSIQAAFDRLQLKPSTWTPPSEIEQVEVDAVSGYPAHDEYAKRTEYVLSGTLPSLPDPIHTKLKLCRGENKLATDARVAAGDYDEKEFYVLKENDPVNQMGKNLWQVGIDNWINSRNDEKYKVPTEYCGDQQEIFVKLEKPENEKSYTEEEIEVEITAESGEEIDRLELWVNGNLQETIRSHRYKGKIKLNKGRHELYAKAITKSNKEAKSRTARIGTGGEDWKKPDPTPTPTPSPSPSPSPSLSPLPTPLL